MKYIVAVIVVLGLVWTGFSVRNSIQLVQFFDKVAQEEDVQSHAQTIEVSEVDSEIKQKWIIKARSADTDGQLENIKGEDVEAHIFGSDSLEKAVIVSDEAFFDRLQSQYNLQKNVKVVFHDKGIEMLTEELFMKKKQPIQIKKPVRFILDTASGKELKAQSALISSDITYITLYKVARSQIEEGLFIQANKMEIGIADDKNGDNLALYGAVKVEHKDMVCKSNTLLIESVDGKPYRAIFEGNPRAVQKGTLLEARKIIYSFPTNKLEAIGRVRTSIIQ